MYNLPTIRIRNNSETLILSVLVAVLSLSGCASTVEKDANKNLFQQALVIQKVKTNSDFSKSSLSTEHSSSINNVASLDKIEWLFSAQQVQPSAKQKYELFVWFSQLTNYSDHPILLKLGPDWISSYKRGKALRKMIPRGILIEQQYDDRLPKHKVIFSLKGTAEKLVHAEGAL